MPIPCRRTSRSSIPITTCKSSAATSTEADLKCDVLAVLDTSAWSQLGPMADVVRNTSARRVVIDHHVSQDDMSAEVFKDTTSESTGRLVLQAIDAIGATVTPQMATPLFAAIATDTGWFRFPSVGEATLSAAARLVAAGAKPHQVFAVLYEQNSLARLLLQGRILTNVKSHLGGRLLSTAITQADLKAVGAEATDTEDVINRLLSVAGVEVALFFLELGPQETKVSLRSRSTFDVNQDRGALRRRRPQSCVGRSLSRAAQRGRAGGARRSERGDATKRRSNNREKLKRCRHSCSDISTLDSQTLNLLP